MLSFLQIILIYLTTNVFQHLNINKGSARGRHVYRSEEYNLTGWKNHCLSNVEDLNCFAKLTSKPTRSKSVRQSGNGVQIERFKKLYLIVNVISTIWIFSQLVKYTILISIRFGLLPQNHHHISCAFIGRLELYGRDNDFPAVVITLHACFRLYWSFMAIGDRDYYFDWLESLFSEENRRRQLEGRLDSKRSGRDLAYSANFEQCFGKGYPPQIAQQDSISSSDIDHNTEGSHRDASCLKNLRLRALSYSIVLVVFTFLTIIIVTVFQLPLILTQQGVRKRYHHCISYLTSNETDIEQLTFGSIYRSLYLDDISTPEGKTTYQLTGVPSTMWPSQNPPPINSLKLVNFNFYQLARIIFELLDHTFIVHDIFVSVLSPVFFVAVTLDDAMLCYARVYAQLDKIVDDLRFRDLASRHEEAVKSELISVSPNGTLCRLCVKNRRRLGLRRARLELCNYDRLHRIRPLKQIPHISLFGDGKKIRIYEDNKTRFHQETCRVQLMISDMITIIGSYNPFLSGCLMRYVSAWAMYSVFVASWMFQPNDLLGSSKFECYFFHAIASSMTAMAIYRCAMVRQTSLKLYSMIAHCMAVENTCLENKVRWSKLLCLYHPLPMHCFRAFQKTEFSLFFGLKLVAWIFSALFLSLTFYNYFI